MTSIVLQFSHEATANCLVAGIPAAARAAHQVSLAARDSRRIDRCVIAVPGGWMPSAWCETELARLVPDIPIEVADSRSMGALADARRIRGEALLPAARIRDLLFQPPRSWSDGPVAGVRRSPAPGDLAELRREGEAIIAATAKPSDGIVSRHINRPISRSISAALLNVPGVKPGHATLGAAVLGIAMVLCLFAGGERGLLIGAVLFQLASIADGVDGEIARATFRASRSGAMLDSMTDAATNLAFFAGVAFNLWLGGQTWAAAAGAAGLVLLFIGLLLIGRQAVLASQPLSFDAVKDHFGSQPSRLKQWLTWLTMRDFYAAAAALCVLAGLAAQMLVIFAAVAAVWLAITLAVLSRASGTPYWRGGSASKPVLSDPLPTR